MSLSSFCPRPTEATRNDGGDDDLPYSTFDKVRTPRDNRNVVSEAFENAMAEGALSEAVLTRAQQILMAPKTRLHAELAWILGVVPATGL
jgi:hypothetical protein